MGCSLLFLVRCKSANLYIMYSLAGYLIDLRGVTRKASEVCSISTYPTHHALQGARLPRQKKFGFRIW